MQMKPVHKRALQALPLSKKQKVFGLVYEDDKGREVGAYPLYAPYEQDAPDENGVVEIGFVPSSKHAISAIALASRHKKTGQLTAQAFNQIVKRAASVLKYCRDNTNPESGSSGVRGTDPRRVDRYEGAVSRLPARRKKAKKKVAKKKVAKKKTAKKKVSIQSALTRAARRRRG